MMNQVEYIKISQPGVLRSRIDKNQEKEMLVGGSQQRTAPRVERGWVMDDESPVSAEI